MVQPSSRTMGVSIFSMREVSAGGDGSRKVSWKILLSGCTAGILHALKLTVGFGPGGDAGLQPGPLFSERAHGENVLRVVLQTLYGHRLYVGVCH